MTDGHKNYHLRLNFAVIYSISETLYKLLNAVTGLLPSTSSDKVHKLVDKDERMPQVQVPVWKQMKQTKTLAHKTRD